MSQNNQEQLNKASELARDILHLSRNTILVNLRFMDAVIGHLNFKSYSGSFSTDGKYLYYDINHILTCFKFKKEYVVRLCLHSMFHCVFQHFYVNKIVKHDLWDLACDIAVECVLLDLNLESALLGTENDKRKVITRLQKEVKIISAEKLYHYFLYNNISQKELNGLKKLFTLDEHSIWYQQQEIQEKNSSSDNHDENGENNNQQDSKDETQQDKGNQGDDADVSNTMNEIKKLKEQWEDISKRMETDVETFLEKSMGDSAGALLQSLKEINREKYDYSSFLKKFAVMGEVMKINDDEFDYIYYTYGLSLYKNTPLIEPLEYKDVKRIKEFVIAIDTSGSVSGELVQRFIQKTYNILKSTESFFSKINIHIIQCDTEIQEDKKITNERELESYIKSMVLRGFGGTDFRPVFSYVDKLIKNKEFTNLKGLIYFTDGWGGFPERKPPYDTAFAFIEDDWNNYDVPPWAIKLILRSDEI